MQLAIDNDLGRRMAMRARGLNPYSRTELQRRLIRQHNFEYKMRRAARPSRHRKREILLALVAMWIEALKKEERK